MLKYFLIFFTSLLTDVGLAQHHHWDTTLTINKKSFSIETKELSSEKVLLLARSKFKKVIIDTLYREGLLNVELTDLNKDHHADIMVTYIGNNPTYFLYLFDQSKDRFKELKGYENFPDAIQLKAYPLFYYSYHRAGCADFDWMSDLFKIENFKTIHIGHIYGQGCAKDLKLYPQKIDIYKVIDNNENQKVLIKTIPYKKAISINDDKWEFIEAYWNKNFSKF